MIKDFMCEMLKTIKFFAKDMEPIVGFSDDQQSYHFCSRHLDGRYFKVSPNKNISDLKGSICLAKINYLNAIFDSSFIKDSSVLFNYGHDDVLQNIVIESNKMSSVYQAMVVPQTAMVAQITRPLVFNNFPVNFTVEKTILQEFREIKRIISAYEKPEMLLVELQNNDLRAYFDARGDKVNILLKSRIVGPDLSSKFSVDQFESLLSISSQYDNSKIYYSNKAIKVEIKLPEADYLFLISTKKEALKKVS